LYHSISGTKGFGVAAGGAGGSYNAIFVFLTGTVFDLGLPVNFEESPLIDNWRGFVLNLQYNF